MKQVSTAVATVRHSPAQAGYYVVMGAVVAIFSALWLFEGHYLFTGWFPSLYDELTPVNGVAAGAFMSLLLVCSVVSLVRPATALGPSKVLVVGAGLFGVMISSAFLLDEPLLTVLLLAVSLSILTLVVWLHPSRESLPPTRPIEPDYLLLALTVVVAVPFLWLAIDLQWSQLTRSDAVAERWFYGGLALYLLVVISLLTLASLDSAVRQFAALSGAFLGGVLGLVSVVYPAELHSLGTVGGGLLLAWCVCVAVAALRE